MKKGTYTTLLILGCIAFLAGSWNPAVAQEEVYELGCTEVFGKLSRAPVTFDHDIHMEVLEEEGCGACHHVFDEEDGGLVYEEGEETSCMECHASAKVGKTPGLREAYHGNCTACHRSMSKKKEKAGPVTCGGCHKKK